MHEKVQRKFFGAILRYLRACNVGPHRLVLNDHEAGSLLFDLEQEHLHQWMPFSATAREVIWRMRSRVRSRPWSIGDDEVTTLEGALGRENVEHLAQEIVDFLASIPYPSTFWARLRGVKLALTEPVDLGPFRLRTVGQAHATPEDLLPDNIFAGRGRPGLSVGEMPRAILRADDIVLEIGVSGYSSHKISDSSPIQALSLLKEFLTLADAVEVLAPNRRAEPDDAPALMLGELTAEPQATVWLNDIPPNVTRRVESHGLAESVERHRLRVPAIKRIVEHPPPKRVEEVRNRLDFLTNIFAPDADKHMTSLRTAAQWYFDSCAEPNETTAFLFACLGLESLLGGDRQETDGVGLKKLLANRLAYSIGGDRASREQVIGEFHGFYDKRSDLVHGRALRLDRENRKWLTQGREWLRLSIRKEVFARLNPPYYQENF